MNLKTPARFDRYKTTVPGVGEVVDAVIYDSQVYVDNTTTALDFFLTTSTSLIVSNMKAAGQMPGNESFLVRGIGFAVRPLTTTPATIPTLDDVQKLVSTGVLRLTVGSKSYGEWPLHRLPEGTGVHGVGFENNAATTIQFAGNGWPDPRNVYALSSPILLEPNLNFNCRCEWPTAQNISANVLTRVMLFGELARPIQ